MPAQSQTLPPVPGRRGAMTYPANDGRRRRGLDTKRRILDAASVIIADDEDLTMVAVAKRSGVSQRNIFEHFRTIEVLTNAVRGIHLDACIERIGALTRRPEEDTLQARVDAMLEALKQAYGESAQKAQLLWSFKQQPRRKDACRPEEMRSYEAAEAAAMRFHAALDHLTGMFLRVELKQLFEQGRSDQVNTLRIVIAAQVHPIAFDWFLMSVKNGTQSDEVGIRAVATVLLGTVREYLREQSSG